MIFVAWCELLTFYEAVNDVFNCGAIPEANNQVNNRMLHHKGSKSQGVKCFSEKAA